MKVDAGSRISGSKRKLLQQQQQQPPHYDEQGSARPARRRKTAQSHDDDVVPPLKAMFLCITDSAFGSTAAARVPLLNMLPGQPHRVAREHVRAAFEASSAHNVDADNVNLFKRLSGTTTDCHVSFELRQRHADGSVTVRISSQNAYFGFPAAAAPSDDDDNDAKEKKEQQQRKKQKKRNKKSKSKRKVMRHVDVRFQQRFDGFQLLCHHGRNGTRCQFHCALELL
jgi:hypothetical protein